VFIVAYKDERCAQATPFVNSMVGQTHKHKRNPLVTTVHNGQHSTQSFVK